MSDDHARSFSIGRVLLVVIPMALVGWAAMMYSGNLKDDAQADLERTMVSRLLRDAVSPASLSNKYADADGDLVADPPAKDARDPQELKFSYVASSDTEDDAETWKELLAAIQSRLGRTVTLVAYNDADEQLRALAGGELHITAFATGEAQGAVNEAGFVPVACFADEDGKFSYSMKIIVPADSPVKEVQDLKGQRVTFVRPRSNSGCTAALVLLMKEHGLQPERDYSWGFSYGHENSIRGIAEKKFSAAAVASDILDRMVASGDVDGAAIRTIYESTPYPPGVIGYAHDLTPELRDGIREALLGFQWEGTGLEKTYGASAAKFAPVDYKKDWAPIREINKTGSDLFVKLDGPAA